MQVTRWLGGLSKFISVYDLIFFYLRRVSFLIEKKQACLNLLISICVCVVMYGILSRRVCVRVSY